MISEGQSRGSPDMMAVNCAVFSFIVVLLFVVSLALPGEFVQFPISFRQGFMLTGAFALVLHYAVVSFQSKKLPATPNSRGKGSVKALEYTVSVVCWVLYFLLWWYQALEAASVFLFIPTYFATSLIAYHTCFNYFAHRQINKMTLLVLLGNIATLGHYTLIFLRIAKP